MEQNFEDWKKNNPSGTLNDFYRNGNKSVIAPSTTPTTFVSGFDPTVIETASPYQKTDTESRNLIIGIGISLLGFIGYFTPWFTIPIFNLSVSGNDIAQLTNLFKNHITVTDVSLLKYAFVLPITYGIVFLGTISKSYLLSVMGIIGNLFVVGFLLGKIFVDMPDLLSFINIGIYLIGLSWFGMLYYLIALK